MEHVLPYRVFWLFRLATTILVLYCQFTDSFSDWLESCGSCHCNWNSGRKTADCKNRHLTFLPTNMSNEIQVIELSNNKIVGLQRHEFFNRNFSNLQKLYMRNCKVEKIDRDAFTELGILIELDLSHNLIQVIHSGTFTGLKKLRNLIMNDNRIEVLDDYMFDNLPFLLRVELKNNRIRDIGIYAFRKLPMLAAVDVEGNELQSLRRETFQQAPKLISLSLSDNHWNCSCNLQDFRDYIIKNRLYTSPTSCYSPANLHGKLWSEVPSDHFACKPRIISLDRELSESQTKSITLLCRIIGAPHPNITWIYNTRPINTSDARIEVLETYETKLVRYSGDSIIASKLSINDAQPYNNGVYTCVAENFGGRAEAKLKLFVDGRNLIMDDQSTDIISASQSDTSTNILLHICVTLTTLLILLTIIVLIVCHYCSRLRSYQKRHSQNRLAGSNISQTTKNSASKGSIVLDMDSASLKKVNPVGKSLRYVEFAGLGQCGDISEIKETLLDTKLSESLDGQCDIETYVEPPHYGLQAYIEKSIIARLPPDLLPFPDYNKSNLPSMQGSDSNICGKSTSDIQLTVVSDPPNMLVTQSTIHEKVIMETPTRFRTLQYKKANNWQNQITSPFLSAHSKNSDVTISHGYVTLPRQPRANTCTKPVHLGSKPATFSISETGSRSKLEWEGDPIYDNLGLRTTVGGNLNIDIHESTPAKSDVRYNIQQRALKEMSRSTSQESNACSNVSQLERVNPNCDILAPMHNPADSSFRYKRRLHSSSYVGYQELMNQIETPLLNISYETVKPHSNLTIVPMSKTIAPKKALYSKAAQKPKKIPPRPPPKPIKIRAPTRAVNMQGSNNEYVDEQWDYGTEV